MASVRQGKVIMSQMEIAAKKGARETDEVVNMLRGLVRNQEPESPKRSGTPKVFWFVTAVMGLTATAGGYMLFAYLSGQRNFLPFLGW